MATDSEVNGKKTMKKFSVSEIANMSTLKPEEIEEAEAEASEAFGEDGDEGFDGESTANRYNIPTQEEKQEDPRMEHYGETITLVSKPTAQDMFRFMLRHTYFNFIGLVGILISIGAIVLLILGYGRESTFTTVIIAMVALMFTVISPLNIYFRSKKQAAQASEEGRSITYTLSEAGVDMYRGDEYAQFTWDRIFKVVEGKSGFYFYLAANQAFVLPFCSFEGKVDAMRELIMKKVEPKKLKAFKKEA